jgi:uncharacterized protein YgbK (DUF1537 family)
MPSYNEMMLAELRQQRDEQNRQHGELLTAITALAQATQRLEARLAQLQAQAQATAPAQAQAQQPVSAQAQAVAEGQAPPPAENLQSRPGPGRWVGKLLGVAKNATKAILGKSAT